MKVTNASPPIARRRPLNTVTGYPSHDATKGRATSIKDDGPTRSAASGLDPRVMIALFRVIAHPTKTAAATPTMLLSSRQTKMTAPNVALDIRRVSGAATASFRLSGLSMNAFAMCPSNSAVNVAPTSQRIATGCRVSSQISNPINAP